MTTSPKRHFLLELEGADQPIPLGILEYLRAQTRNDLYAFIIKKLLEARREQGLTNAQLARRIGCDPGRLSRLLSAPGNWTIATVSDLLVGIAQERLVPESASLLGGAEKNYKGQDLVEPRFRTSYGEVTGFGDENRTLIVSSTGHRTKAKAHVEFAQ
ncbi:MAG: helix-turn-helix transcriptional regulator [Rhodovibrionaceae bacterium]